MIKTSKETLLNVLYLEFIANLPENQKKSVEIKINKKIAMECMILYSNLYTSRIKKCRDKKKETK